MSMKIVLDMENVCEYLAQNLRLRLDLSEIAIVNFYPENLG